MCSEWRQEVGGRYKIGFYLCAVMMNVYTGVPLDSCGRQAGKQVGGEIRFYPLSQIKLFIPLQ
jgi:hypothetical protein